MPDLCSHRRPSPRSAAGAIADTGGVPVSGPKTERRRTSRLGQARARSESASRPHLKGWRRIDGGGVGVPQSAHDNKSNGADSPVDRSPADLSYLATAPVVGSVWFGRKVLSALRGAVLAVLLLLIFRGGTVPARTRAVAG
jgi:hypothetical protein